MTDSNWFPNDNLSINGQEIEETFVPAGDAPQPLSPRPVLYPEPASPVTPAVVAVDEENLKAPQGTSLIQVPIAKIKPNPWQPRKIFKQEY